MILPPATIGMVGGGQLGRMFAIAANSMGYKVVVLCEDDSAPAAQIAQDTVVGRLDDFDRVTEFASQCDVITLEFENIPAETIAKCNEFAPTYPSSHVLATSQDRLIEKTTFRDADLPVTPFAQVHDADSLVAASESLGWPMIVKTSRDGYDGKGQYRVASADEASSVPWDSFDAWIAEQCIQFDREVSVIVARKTDGETHCFPVFENDHANHVLDVTTIPARVSEQLAEKARRVAISVANQLDVVGLICVELFVVDDENVMINEVAPRPHNSGHLSIEALHTSQFEQHVRAVCGLPFGNSDLISGGAAMANLLGDLWQSDGTPPDWGQAIKIDGVHLHLYGKAGAKPGRKMGHLTSLAKSRDEAMQRVLDARQALK